MDFRFSEEEESFRQEVLQFIKEEFKPDLAGLGWDLEAKTKEEWEFAHAMKRKVGAKGWHALAWPKEYEGQESVAKQFIMTEEMFYNGMPGVDVMGALMCAPALIHHANDEQKRRHLPGIARGETVWCQGFSEPGAGSDLAALSTRAVEEGDYFILNGQKVWNTNAHRADWAFLLARTDPQAPKHKGISFFLLDMKTPGVTANLLPNIVGTYCEIFFDNVRVPKENLVGEKNQGWKVTTAVLGSERSGIQRIGIARRTLKRIIEFAKETKRDNVPLIRDPLVRHKLAQLVIESEAARLLAYRVTWLQSIGQNVGYEASMSRLFGCEFQQRVANTGTQILGLYGQIEPGSKWAPLAGSVERAYRDSLGSTVAAGTSEIQRNTIAIRGFGLPKS